MHRCQAQRCLPAASRLRREALDVRVAGHDGEPCKVGRNSRCSGTLRSRSRRRGGYTLMTAAARSKPLEGSAWRAAGVAVGRETPPALRFSPVHVDQHLRGASPFAAAFTGGTQAKRGVAYGRADLELAPRGVSRARARSRACAASEQAPAPGCFARGRRRPPASGQAQVAAGAVQRWRIGERSVPSWATCADHRCRHGQALRRGREAACVDDLAEHAQAGETVHLDFLWRNEALNRWLSILHEITTSLQRRSAQ